MPTWENLFEGSNIYADVLGVYPNLYTQSVEQGGVFDLYIQMVRSVPHELSLMTAVFYGSLMTLTVILAVMYSLFMPILNRPRRLL